MATLAAPEELRKTVETVMPSHLIDSDCNNQQKFVRTMAGSGFDFVGKNPTL